MAKNKKFFKDLVRVVKGIVGFTFDVILFIILLPLTLVGIVFFPRLVSRMAYIKGHFGITMDTQIFIVLCFLPRHWAYIVGDEIGLKKIPVPCQVDYYFRRERTASTLSKIETEALEKIVADKRLFQTDITNLVENTKFQNIFTHMEEDRQIEIFEMAGVDDRIKLIGLMRDEMAHRAFSKTWDYDTFIKWGFTFNDEELRCLLRYEHQAYKEYFLRIVSRQTPSDEIIKKMIGNPAWQNELLFCVKKYGLSPKIVQTLDAEKLNLLSQAMAEYAQRTFLLKTEDEETLKAFFEKTAKIEPEAQKVMKPYQYALFIDAGHHIDMNALEHFLAKGEVEMFKVFLRGEPNVKMSDKAECLACANPELAKLYVRSNHGR